MRVKMMPSIMTRIGQAINKLAKLGWGKNTSKRIPARLEGIFIAREARMDWRVLPQRINCRTTISVKMIRETRMSTVRVTRIYNPAGAAKTGRCVMISKFNDVAP